MTEKKSTPKGSGDKASRRRHEETTAAIALGASWRDQIPDREFHLALEGLRQSSDAVLLAVERLVSEASQTAARLREIGCEVLADELSETADRYSEVRTPAFQVAAGHVVDLVFQAILTGYPSHVLKLEARISETRLAEWGRICAEFRRKMLLPEHEFDRVMGRSSRHPAISRALSVCLRNVDDLAPNLDPDAIFEAAHNAKLSDAGFAARLACLCNAFGYKSEQEGAAQRAIQKAMGRGGG